VFYTFINCGNLCLKKIWWPDSRMFCGLRKDVERAVYHVILTDKGLNSVKGHNEGAIETNNILVFVWPHTSLISTLIRLILNDLIAPLVILHYTEYCVTYNILVLCYFSEGPAVNSNVTTRECNRKRSCSSLEGIRLCMRRRRPPI
jgi:hypothetical protein